MTFNPCCEIPLGKAEPVMPWVQIQWMNHFRVRDGLPPYTVQEIADLTVELEAQYDNAVKSKGIQTAAIPSDPTVSN